MKCAKALMLFGMIMMFSADWGWVPFVNGVVALRGRKVGNLCDFQITDEAAHVEHEELEYPPVTSFVDTYCRVHLTEIPPIAPQ
jgi:hypothetical protein